MIEPMVIEKQISPAEMIGEFLRAELHTSRFRNGSLRALSMLGQDGDLVENPNYANNEQNNLREGMLGLCRGWPNKELFTNFPTDTRWLKAYISLGELKQSYRLKSSGEMTDEERLLEAVADRVMRAEAVKHIDNELIHEVRKKIKEHEVLPPIILVGTDIDSRMVLIEGHSRSVAYSTFEQLHNDIPAIVGLSDRMTNWAYF